MKRNHIILSIALTIILVTGFAGFKLYNYFNYTGELIAIKQTNLYHRDNCQFVKKSSMDSLVFHKSIEEYLTKGYLPCRSCNPPITNEAVEAAISILNQKIEEEKVKSKDETGPVLKFNTRNIDNFKSIIKTLEAYKK